jgi:spore coat protein JC
MWVYQKMLQYPAKAGYKDVRMARNILTQYGGPNGESSASMQYLNQRYSMPYDEGRAILTDVGTEEMAHMEMVATLFNQLICGATKDELIENGFDAYYVEHGCNPFYVDTASVPWDAKYVVATGNPEVDLYQDMASEQRAKATYENLVKMTDDPVLKETLRYLREREIVHFQRFGEVIRVIQERYGKRDKKGRIRYYELEEAADAAE